MLQSLHLYDPFDLKWLNLYLIRNNYVCDWAASGFGGSNEVILLDLARRAGRERNILEELNEIE